jgi:hypothetical protein
MKYYYLLLSVILLSVKIPANGQAELKIVATSTWTAGYIRLAGIDKFDVLAPSEMQHPSEYELQIEDIIKLRDADLIICGGYETMMEKIRKGLQIDPVKILQIQTDYNLAHIETSVRSIAKKTGTDEKAEKNLGKLKSLFDDSKQKIREAGIAEIPVLVQFYLRTFSEELGLNITGIFGPRQLEAYNIQELMKIDFKLILDNAHNPSARPLVETRKGTKIVYLINFPGINGTETIEDVIRYNVKVILDAYNAGR